MSLRLPPILRKPDRITGHRLVMRDARPDDAVFILALRTDPQKSRYLSAVSDDVQRQRQWLLDYAARDDQVYLIIEDELGQAFGTVRLYDARGTSFCWGSWVLREGSPSAFAIESALLVYHYARSLGFTAAHFDVVKENESVWRFHERFGAQRTGETPDGAQWRYEIGPAAIEASLSRYARYLPQGLRIDPPA